MENNKATNATEQDALAAVHQADGILHLFSEHLDGSVVLASLPQGRPQKWVTWRVVHSGVVCAGHYFDTIQAAQRDFLARIGYRS